MASAALSEPHVLAHAKRRLFPDADEPDTYSVVDSQFAKEEWLPGQTISPDVKEDLVPFNHVRLGSSYPDLVGVRLLESDLLAVERFGDQPPLIAVQAKGFTDTGTVDVVRGVVQAYDRLQEAITVFVGAPLKSVPESRRTLVREIDVRVLGVDP